MANRVAHVGREAWLRTLDKERGISPVQYARDIIYPALALRKLSAERVQVTPQDIKNAFEAQYGDKLRCRIIMVDKLQQGAGDLGRAAEEPRRVREAGAGAVDGLRQPVAGRPARRADHPPRLSPERLRRGVPPARRRRPQRQGPRAQAQGRRLHRPDPGGRGDLGPPQAARRSSPPRTSTPRTRTSARAPTR